MKPTIKPGLVVDLLSGFAAPVMVAWTVTRVGASVVTLEAAGRPAQRVSRELVAMAAARPLRE